MATKEHFQNHLLSPLITRHPLLVDLLGTLDPLLEFELCEDKIFIFNAPGTRGRRDEEEAFQAIATIRDILRQQNIRCEPLYRSDRRIDGIRLY
jgi:hypothetical protein